MGDNLGLTTRCADQVDLEADICQFVLEVCLWTHVGKTCSAGGRSGKAGYTATIRDAAGHSFLEFICGRIICVVQPVSVGLLDIKAARGRKMTITIYGLSTYNSQRVTVAPWIRGMTLQPMTSFVVLKRQWRTPGSKNSVWWYIRVMPNKKLFSILCLALVHQKPHLVASVVILQFFYYSPLHLALPTGMLYFADSRFWIGESRLYG